MDSLEGLEGSRALHGALSDAEREEILFAFRRGEIPVLFMSPELAFGRAREALLEAAKPPEEKFGLEARLAAVFVRHVDRWHHVLQRREGGARLTM